jgi:serine/threonine protein kinase
MDLQFDSRLGRYEPVAVLGTGALGCVYRARDPRLGRNVAIKVTRQPFTDQFEREARATMALNHSNICSLYDAGPNYLVMELIEGPTLADRLRHGALRLEGALQIAKQIADALEAAHDKSIVHRHLKPANVKIRPDGSVKVLDFGLAPDSLQRTMAVRGVQYYMSPEQVRGEALDQRVDIWAFGVVLYEMVTGKRPFDKALTFLTEEADLTQAPEKTRPLLLRCLQKDPQKRLRDVRDVMPLLE